MFDPKKFEYNYHIDPTQPGVMTLNLTKKQLRKLRIKSLIPLAICLVTIVGLNAIAEEIEQQAQNDLDDNQTPTGE